MTAASVSVEETFARKRNTLSVHDAASGTLADHVLLLRTGNALEHRKELSDAKLGDPLIVIAADPGSPDDIETDWAPSSHGQYATTFSTTLIAVPDVSFV